MQEVLSMTVQKLADKIFLTKHICENYCCGKINEIYPYVLNMLLNNMAFSEINS